MSKRIGIRKEDKNIWERRVPLTPTQVKKLVDAGLQVRVEPFDRRAFPDDEYRAAGASLEAGLDDCDVVMAVKEVPTKLLRADTTYIYFAHVIKGQAYNMGMLARILELGATLIDYERVVDEKGRRLIFFGRHAGLAGMIDSLWALGQRLRIEGFDTPFTSIQMANTYADLEAAKAAVSEAGRAIAEKGLPIGLQPQVFGFAGYGNVSLGAQEIFDLLPHETIEPAQLPQTLKGTDSKRLTKVVFHEKDMAAPLEAGAPFDLQEYYKHPQRYRGVFAKHVPYLSVLINCIYWTPDYPRLVSRDLLRGMYGAGLQPRLRIIGDISIDIEGAIECSLKATDPGDPVYVFLPGSDEIVPGLEGHGPVVLAVDNLPCELPVEASRDFGVALLPFMEAIATTDYGQSYEKLALPQAIKTAVIAHRGQLTPEYAYLKQHLDGTGGES